MLRAIWAEKRVWIPLILIVALAFFYINLYMTVANQYSLRQICLELNESADCNTDEALKKAAQFGIPSSVIPGIIMVISIGIFGAVSNRLGRKKAFIIGLVGQFFLSFGWFLVYYFPSLSPHWRPLVISGLAVQSATGGVLVLALALFGIINDMSAKNPSVRIILYVFFELLNGTAGVVGAQIAAQLMKSDNRILVGILAAGTIINLILVVLFLPETIDPEVQKKPIQKKKANTIGQLAFLFPFKSTLEIIHADTQMVYDKLSGLYEQQQLNRGGIDISTQSSNDIDENIYINQSTAIADPSIGMINGFGLEFDEGKYIDDVNATRKPNSITNIDGEINSNRKTSLLSDSYDSSNNNSSQMQYTNSDGHNNGAEFDERGIPYLKLSQPPRLIHHKNSYWVLALSLCFIVMIVIGNTQITFAYMKKLFNITPQNWSNILSIAAVVRCLGSLGLFPLFKKYVKTPTGEKYFLSLLCLVQAIAFGIATQVSNYTFFACLIILYYFTSVFPVSIIRSLMSNQVTQQLQQQVLSVIAITEVLVLALSGLTFNLVWSETQDTHPSIILWVWVGICCLGALAPFLIRDSKDDFNFRIEMVTQYTKIMAAEQKWLNEQDELLVQDQSVVENGLYTS